MSDNNLNTPRTDDKPDYPTINPEYLPEFLRDRKCFTLWKWEHNGKKWTKVALARWNLKSRHLTLDEAIERANKVNSLYRGIGMVLSNKDDDVLTLYDFDGGEEDATLIPQIAGDLSTDSARHFYCQQSVSGRGVHMIAYSPNANKGQATQPVEVYNTKAKFVAMTTTPPSPRFQLDDVLSRPLVWNPTCHVTNKYLERYGAKTSNKVSDRSIAAPDWRDVLHEDYRPYIIAKASEYAMTQPPSYGAEERLSRGIIETGEARLLKVIRQLVDGWGMSEQIDFAEAIEHYVSDNSFPAWEWDEGLGYKYEQILATDTDQVEEVIDFNACEIKQVPLALKHVRSDAMLQELEVLRGIKLFEKPSEETLEFLLQSLESNGDTMSSHDAEEVLDDLAEGNDDWDFPTHVLGPPLEQFVNETAHSTGVSKSMVAVPMMSVLGGCIGSSVKLQVKKGWTESASIFSLILANSGSGKSPALKAVTAPTKKLTKELREQYLVEKSLYEEATKKGKKSNKSNKSDDLTDEDILNMVDEAVEPQKPAYRRLTVQDTTVEALVPVLQQNPKGLLLVADELSQWASSIGEYKANGKGGDADKWISLYNSTQIQVDRKSQEEPLEVDEPHLSLTGGLQPARMDVVFKDEHKDSGMASRFLMAMPQLNSIPRWTDAEVSDEVVQEYETLVRTLFGLPAGTVTLELSPEARDLWIEYYNALASHRETVMFKRGDHYEAANLAKFQSNAARLAVILHCVEHCHGGQDITGGMDTQMSGGTMRRALELAEWFRRERTRIKLVLEGVTNPKWSGLLDHISRRPGGRILTGQLLEHPAVPSIEVARGYLEQFAEEGRGTFDPQKGLFKLHI